MREIPAAPSRVPMSKEILEGIPRCSRCWTEAECRAFRNCSFAAGNSGRIFLEVDDRLSLWVNDELVHLTHGGNRSRGRTRIRRITQ